MRIIGGSLRNRTLKAPKGLKTRPTLAVLRKAVFDICQSHIDGATFLDLFAGSGAMGIEAISRGAHLAVFVDKDRDALRCLRENLQNLQIETSARILADDALHALTRFSKQHLRFDIMYIDPPYANGAHLLPEILTFIDTHDLLNPQALVFVEESTRTQFNANALPFQHLFYVNGRVFSGTTLHQFQKK